MPRALLDQLSPASTFRSLIGVFGRIQGELSRKLASVFVEHEIDTFADVHGHRDLGAIMELFELVALLRGHVDGRGNLLPRHREIEHTIREHTSGFKMTEPNILL